MSNYLKILLLSLLQSFNLNAQDEFYVRMNKVLDKKEEEINQKAKEITRLNDQIKKLSEAKKLNETKLQKALQKWHFAVLELEQKELELQLLVDKNSSLNRENHDLNDLINRQKITIEELESKIQDQDRQIQKKLTKIEKVYIYVDAKENAEKDFKLKRKKTRLPTFTYNESLIHTHLGFLLISGVEYNIQYGEILDENANVYLGLGTGYQGIASDTLFTDNSFFIYNSYSSIPVYTSLKYTFNDSFYSKDEDIFDFYGDGPFNSSGVIYLNIDLGYSFVLNNPDNIRGGFFTNIGAGCSIDFRERVALDFVVSWRNRGTKILESKKRFNSLDLRGGFVFLIGK